MPFRTMSTSIKHKRFVDSVMKGLKKAIDTLIDDSIKQNDDLVVVDIHGNIKRINPKDLKTK